MHSRDTRWPSWPSRVARLLAIILLIGPVVLAQQPAEPALVLHITDGQQFADACASFCRRNSDTTLLLPARTIISLANATFSSNVTVTELMGGQTCSSGVLTIQGADSSVLDAGMRAGLVRARNGGASRHVVALNDVAIINNCADARPLVNLERVTQLRLGIFSVTPVYRSLVYRNAIVYMRQTEVRYAAYLFQLQRTVWEPVRQRYQQQLSAFGNMGAVVRRTTAQAITLASIQAGGWGGRNLTLASTRNPSDPVLQAMRRSGTLLPLRWCTNQSLVDPAINDAQYDPVWGPLFVMDTANGTVSALVEATAVAVAQAAQQLPIPALLVHMPRVDLSEATVPGGLRLGAALQLWGPFNDVASDLQTVPVLDVGGRSSSHLFNLYGAGQLFITRLTLAGLAPQLQAPRSAATSALRFSSLANTSSSSSSWDTNAPIQLHNVTLLLPLPDYLALLTLALDSVAGASMQSCMDAETLQLAAQLRSSIYQIVVAAPNDLSSVWQALSLSSYDGWGVNARELVVRPETAVPAQVLGACPVMGSPSPSSDGGGPLSSSTIGIIVGCTVGSVVLLLALAAAAVRRRRRRYHASGAPSKERVKAASPRVPLAPGAREGDAPTGTGAADASCFLPTLALLMLRAREQRLLSHINAETLAQYMAGSSAATAPTSRAPQSSSVRQDQADAAGAPGSLLARAHEALLDTVAGAASAVPSHQGPRAAGIITGSRDSSGGAHTSSPRTTVVGTMPVRASLAEELVHCVSQTARKLNQQGATANKVTLEALLGQGGYGVVYLGDWRGLPVAVKTVVYEANSADELTTAVMETAIAASIGHRNLVATYHYDIKRMGDQGVTGGEGLQVYDRQGAVMTSDFDNAELGAFKVFLIQELCQSSLKDILVRGALQDPNMPAHVNAVLTYSLLEDVATGLQYLHERGIIHGDLTPGNVLLKLDDRADVGLVAKLADFGLSRHLGPHATHVSNFASGTPFYVAPEVVEEHRTSPAADIFSLGVIMWQALTGNAPYVTRQGGSFQLNPMFPSLRAEDQVPRELEVLLVRCLQRDPRLRPTACQVKMTLSLARAAVVTA